MGHCAIEHGGNGHPSASFPEHYIQPALPSGFIPDAIPSPDLNGDGNADWAVANAGDNDVWIYFGNGDGTAQTPT